MAASHVHSDQAHGNSEWTRLEGLAARAGFTLIELLTAFVVMGFATTIFINLYFGSVTISESNRSQRVAASLAEEYMTHILNYPGNLDWSEVFDAEARNLEAGDPNVRIRVALPDVVEIPSTIPTISIGLDGVVDQRSYTRTQNLYARFKQEAWARIPMGPAGAEEAAEYLEVVVIISWYQGGRNHLFSLTSTIPRERAKEYPTT